MNYYKYKIKHDGSHFVSTRFITKDDNSKAFKTCVIMDNVNALADLYIFSGIDKEKICNDIYQEIISKKELSYELEKFIERGNDLMARITDKVENKLLFFDLLKLREADNEIVNAMRSDFNSIYKDLYSTGCRSDNLHDMIKSEFLPKYGNLPIDLDVYIDKNIDRNARNLRDRVKRFRDKGNLVNWQYFFTQTYDDKKHTEESFVESFKKCIGNLHTRYGWLIMGGFERSPENHRLHFHGVAYIPDGAMKGKIIERKDFSFKTRTVQCVEENSYFLERFGRNDFEPLSTVAIEHSNAINYCMKYIFKTECKLFYTRGIPTYIERVIYKRDIALSYYHYDTKRYVLFDDWQESSKACKLPEHCIDYKIRQVVSPV